jgi:hypothetical protein
LFLSQGLCRLPIGTFGPLFIGLKAFIVLPLAFGGGILLLGDNSLPFRVETHTAVAGLG